MNPFLERLYHHSPVALQNVGVSLYGLKLYRERYGRGARKHLRGLLESQHYSQEQMARLQEERFVTLARHAIESVPYYRNWARSIGLEARDIRSRADLSLFPILEKQTIRERPTDLISERFHPRQLIELGTSGTTGTPLRLFVDRSARTQHYAFFSRLRHWYGLPARSRRATLFGRVILKGTDSKPPFWRYDMSQRNLLMSSYHLNRRNLPHYYAQLKRYRPQEIIGYASSLYAIARYIVDSGSPPLAPKLIISTAEPLLPYQRHAIEQAFDAQICDQYGCAEMAFFASECPSGTMHLHPEHGIAEVLPSGSRAPSPSGSGELVATGLLNTAMPLIRYRVGDTLQLGSNAACTCGLTFPTAPNLEGRTDDLVVTHSGTPIGRFSPIFRADKAIKEAQIIQSATGAIEVKIVPDAHYGSSHAARLRAELRARVGDDIPVTVTPVETILKDPNGKFRAVVSHYRPLA